jgi:endonuclease/exonuclease/phosphatase family metal-dependent hydrolase
VKKLLAAVAAVTLLVPAGFMSASASAEHAPATKSATVTVMTRNLYLGADIQRPIAATAGKTGPAALVALGNANHELREIVDQTDFVTRARLLAKEIAGDKPDLVGLQEVALWRSGPIELPPDGALGVPNATHVDQDFLRILLWRLAQAGVFYAPVSVQIESDIEAPSFLGSPFDGSISDPSDQRLTMRDVILKRIGSPVRVTDTGSGNYQARLELDIAGLPASFIRGYNWVDARLGSKHFRFVNTHLEAFSSDLALFQAQELLAGAVADSPGTTILACDCNSDPLNHTVKPTDPLGTPHSGPYDFIVGSGFTDEWLRWAPAEEGWTSGLSETVDDPTAAGFDHRIDMVFARGAEPGGLSVVRGAVTGNEVSDRDSRTGLWPSDHAGVVLTLRLP